MFTLDVHAGEHYTVLSDFTQLHKGGTNAQEGLWALNPIYNSFCHGSTFEWMPL